MFETNNTPRTEVMAVTSMQAVRLHKAPAAAAAASQAAGGSETQGSSGQSVTMQQAERVLARLVEEKWFEKSGAGYYSLSPRALMELRGWLVETYNEEEEDEQGRGFGRWEPIKFCQACRDIVTVVSYSRHSLWIKASLLWLTGSTVGPTMSEPRLHLPHPLHLHGQLVQSPTVPLVSALQHGVDRGGLCWGEGRKSTDQSATYRRGRAEERETGG